ncbi:uncharacterized protein LOC112597748 [Melanaphis sacchari]|uniref:uncharacterized protein LOC112597748 n=1 Tax=Melanaphis sacchari TaxID=742174 RepID=UPI000DC1508B|nr:uncharacterized protein LOC112597748 [Melanaphis sacchari]
MCRKACDPILCCAGDKGWFNEGLCRLGESLFLWKTRRPLMVPSATLAGLTTSSSLISAGTPYKRVADRLTVPVFHRRNWISFRRFATTISVHRKLINQRFEFSKKFINKILNSRLDICRYTKYVLLREQNFIIFPSFGIEIIG